MLGQFLHSWRPRTTAITGFSVRFRPSFLNSKGAGFWAEFVGLGCEQARLSKYQDEGISTIVEQPGQIRMPLEHLI